MLRCDLVDAEGTSCAAGTEGSGPSLLSLACLDGRFAGFLANDRTSLWSISGPRVALTAKWSILRFSGWPGDCSPRERFFH